MADHLSDAADVVVPVASVPGRSALNYVKLMCPGCRDCFLPGNPCSVCESLSATQVALAIQARSLRLRRQARRAGSTDSASQCGPLEDNTGHPGSNPGPPVSEQGGTYLLAVYSIAGWW